MERDVPIRSISRCIAVLKAINRHGSLSLMDIARMSTLPYPTACRVVQTLVHEGLIECEPTRKCYRATAQVRALSHGFQNADRLVAVARPVIRALTRKLGWPMVVSTRAGSSMMVRETTHDLTSLTFDLYPPGYTLPMLECGSGHVYLAHVQDEEREDIIEALEPPAKRSPFLPLFQSGATIGRIRADGFATFDYNSHTASPAKTTSISVPIHEKSRPVGALSMAFFTSSMPMDEALKRFLADMKDAASRIGESISGAPIDAAVATGKAEPLSRRRNVAPSGQAVAVC